VPRSSESWVSRKPRSRFRTRETLAIAAQRALPISAESGKA